MNTFAKIAVSLAAAVGIAGIPACASPQSNPADEAADGNTLVLSDNLPENQASAVFAMGCFWCAESDFEKVDGVVDVISGYTGGTVANPSYEQVTYAETGHYEAVLVTYDTTKLNYEDLLSVFWRNVDPFDPRGQFCDKGSSYRAAIFPGNDSEAELAEVSKAKWMDAFGQEITTEILGRTEFYSAEDYHQDYYSKNPVRYGYYRNGCGRDRRLDAIWGNIPQ